MTQTHTSRINISTRYKEQFRDRRFVWSLVGSFALLIAALVINYYGATYAFESASNSVTDIILSNIPTFKVGGIFIWGPILFWIILSLYLLQDPKLIPFTLKSVGLFVVVRSFFVSLTHLGPVPDRIPLDVYGANFATHLDSSMSFLFSSGADLFFSGHTGIPFLLCLIFWDHKPIRYFCLVTSIFFGTVVLLGHLHYTIDVAAAFFITFTISHLATFLFKKDKQRFNAAAIIS